MFFKKIETKGIAHYSYMIGDGEYIAVIDPVRDISIYMDKARRFGKKIKYILETHRNEDYVSGSIELGEKTGAQIYISGHEDLGHVYGQKIKDGHEIELGNIKIRALHTPGHTLGHLSYALFEKNKEEAYMVFTGDCLFMGDVGRSDFYGKENLEKMTGLLFDSIFKKLLPLGNEVLMFPAHGAGSACGDKMDRRPFSTLGYERKNNSALQVKTKDEFIENMARMRIKPRYFTRIEKLNVEGAPFVGKEVKLNKVTFDEIRDRKDEVLLLDIRGKEAYIGGHIPESIYMSKKSISTSLGSIFSNDEKIIFILDDNIKDLEKIYWYCKRIGFDHIIGSFINGPSEWEENGEELKKALSISAKDYRENKMKEKHILLDIRKKGDVENSDLEKNRINIPLENIYKEYESLDKNKPIYILCNSGESSTIAYSYLKRKGYNPVIISGGINMLRKLDF